MNFKSGGEWTRTDHKNHQFLFPKDRSGDVQETGSDKIRIFQPGSPHPERGEKEKGTRNHLGMDSPRVH